MHRSRRRALWPRRSARASVVFAGKALTSRCRNSVIRPQRVDSPMLAIGGKRGTAAARGLRQELKIIGVRRTKPWRQSTDRS